MTACGGGGGGGDDTAAGPTDPTPTNPAPGDGPVDDPQTPTPTDPAPTDPQTPTPTDPAPTDPTNPPPAQEPIPSTPGEVTALNCATCSTTLKDVVVDGSNNATVVWAENDNGVQAIKAARYDAATSAWSRQTLSIGAPSTLQVGADAAGNVTAGWLINGAFSMARFDVATGTWGAPRQFFRVNAIPAGPKTFTVDPNGNIYFAYFWLPADRFTPEGFPVQSTEVFIYTPATATTAESFKRGRVDSGQEHAVTATIDTDDQGNAILLWSTRLTGDPGAFRGKVYVSRYRPTNGYWGRVRELATEGGFSPSVSLRPNGRATAVYGLTANGINDIRFRQYDPVESLWSPARSFNLQSPQPAIGLNVEADRNGNAIIAWAEADRGQRVRRFTAGAETFSPIVTFDDGADVSVPDIAINPNTSNSVHTFSDNTRSGTTTINRYSPSIPAQLAPTALNLPGQNGSTAEVAIGPDGTAVAVWTQPSGSGTVQNLQAKRVAP